MMGAAPRSVVEQEGKLQMDSLRDCLSYCSSIYTFYKYVLVSRGMQKKLLVHKVLLFG